MEQKLNVYEMRVKLYLLQDIPFKELQNAVANFVDSALCQNESLISFHETNCYKFYSVGTLWPLERGMTYQKRPDLYLNCTNCRTDSCEILFRGIKKITIHRK